MFKILFLFIVLFSTAVSKDAKLCQEVLTSKAGEIGSEFAELCDRCLDACEKGWLNYLMPIFTLFIGFLLESFTNTCTHPECAKMSTEGVVVNSCTLSPQQHIDIPECVEELVETEEKVAEQTPSLFLFEKEDQKPVRRTRRYSDPCHFRIRTQDFARIVHPSTGEKSPITSSCEGKSEPAPFVTSLAENENDHPTFLPEEIPSENFVETNIRSSEQAPYLDTVENEETGFQTVIDDVTPMMFEHLSHPLQQTIDPFDFQVVLQPGQKINERKPMVFVGGIGASTTSLEVVSELKRQGFNVTVVPRIRYGVSFGFCPDLVLSTASEQRKLLDMKRIWVKDRWCDIRPYIPKEDSVESNNAATVAPVTVPFDTVFFPQTYVPNFCVYPQNNQFQPNLRFINPTFTQNQY